MFFGWQKTRRRRFRCANIACDAAEGEPIPENNVYFLCPRGTDCDGWPSQRLKGHPEEHKNFILFRPSRYDHEARCPHCTVRTTRKLCPKCWQTLPIPAGDASTIAVIGTSGAGKTCFITAMLHQIRDVLSRDDKYHISQSWDDDDSRDYFLDQSERIFTKKDLPDSTQQDRKKNLLAMRVRLHVPARHPVSRGKPENPTVPLIIPDPSGELFQKKAKAYTLDLLRDASAYILIVDPLLSLDYRKYLKGERVYFHPSYETSRYAPEQPLDDLNDVVCTRGKCDKPLAVVLAKCDSPGLFDPDEEEFDEQGSRRFNDKLSRDISDGVQAHMRLTLRMNNLVTLASQLFNHTRFFAASALGSPPLWEKDSRGDDVQRLEDPKPRRVEEPLLWILHHWKYIEGR